MSNAAFPDPSQPEKGQIQIGADALMALRFFSRLPTGPFPHQKPDLSTIARGLPLASLAIGLLPALVLSLGAWAGIQPLFAAGLAVALGVAVTGAMSEDALADAFDGLFGGSTAERRLDIMRDSRHGTYAVSALCMFLILRVCAYGALAQIHPLTGALAWLGASIMARSGSLWLSYHLPVAHPEGLSAVVGRPERKSLILGSALALGLGFVCLAPVASIMGFIVLVALGALVAWGWSRVCWKLVNGQTGDLIGALGALLETAFLTALLLFA